jgi:hypothetical protein
MNPQAPQTASLCCVLASDAGFFHQAKAAIDTIKRFGAAFRPAIKFIAIDLDDRQIRLLDDQGVDVLTDLRRFPRFDGAPGYAVAFTCRPYLPEIFPGYECYAWIDSDVRFLDNRGFGFFVINARDPDVSIVISHETDPAYVINADPIKAGIYHRQKNQRLFDAFGTDVARYFEFFNAYNAGLFAARGDSPIWVRYRRNLERTLPLPFSPMREQDALNVSVVEVGGQRNAPCTMNWLCSLCMPARDGDGWWHTPEGTSRKISVVHLTNSTQRVSINGKPASRYDGYRLMGLTE